MFCKNCGKKLDNDSKFCSNCGQKIDMPIQENNKKNKTDIILKQEEFERREFEYSVWANYGHKKIDDGELFLYSDRVLYISSEKIIIPLETIRNVSVEYKYGVGYLFIKTNDKGYCFMQKTKGALTNALALGVFVASFLDKKNPSLEYWREEIEKQRMNVLQSNL